MKEDFSLTEVSAVAPYVYQKVRKLGKRVTG
jgi:hypothetical protein